MQEETQLNLTNILFKYIYALSSFGQHGKSLLNVGKVFWGLGIRNVGIWYFLIFLQEYMSNEEIKYVRQIKIGRLYKIVFTPFEQGFCVPKMDNRVGKKCYLTS